MNSYNSINRSSVIESVISLLIGSAAGLLASAALLSAAAAVFVKSGSVPTPAVPVITGVIGAVSAFTAGWFTVKLFKRKGLMMGAVAGLILFSAVSLTGVFTGGKTEAAALCVRAVLFIVCAAIGGVARVNKRVKVKRQR